MAVNAKNWQELKKPNALERKPGTDVRRKAVFVAEPLERGFGMTLGNSLRRVLLSARCRAPPSPRSRSRACCMSSRASRVSARTSPTSSST